jgi:hypothetical protein
MMMGPAAGCANVPPIELQEAGPVTTVACANNLTDDNSILDWRLEVGGIEAAPAGEEFRTTLRGVAVFPEDFLDAAQPLIPGGVREVNLVDLSATVHVRSGATGPDVTLTVADTREYRCAQPPPMPCDPANDLPSLPGLRGNTDCQPEGSTNACGRFIDMPISTDCDPGTRCDELGKTGPSSQCELNGFCITGDLRIELAEDRGLYTADPEGFVLFGWDDGESTGATIQEDGANEGTWILPTAIYEDATGPIGLRVAVARIGIALECTMGVDSKDPEYGVGSLDFYSSPTPNRALIRIPIEPAF